MQAERDDLRRELLKLASRLEKRLPGEKFLEPMKARLLEIWEQVNTKGKPQ